MPTYEYRCKECGHEFETVQSFSDSALTECPECKGALRKVFGNVGIAFKGSGFYKNDSRASSGAGKSSADSSSSSSKDSDSGSSSSTSSSSSSSEGSGSGAGKDSGDKKPSSGESKPSSEPKKAAAKESKSSPKTSTPA